MTVANLAPALTFKSWTNYGTPNAGGFLYTYAAGTTTPIATYTDNTGGTANANPITLNYRGEPPAGLWLLPNVAYKFTETDSAGNLIKTTDQVINSTLTSLYGGVDTGAANAYVLNFTAPFTALTNGIIIYFVAANANTGAATLNVNGLGSVPIINQNGNTLAAAQIVTSGVTSVFYFNGNWLLTSGALPQQGTFIATCTGGTTSPSVFGSYYISGYLVTLLLSYVSFVSNATTFTLTGIPAVIQPVNSVIMPCAVMVNGSAYINNANAILSPSLAGVITFSVSNTVAGWTASGQKGIGFVGTGVAAAGLGITLSYAI